MDQNELLDKLKSGDKEAFRRFYTQYADSAIRIAYGITRNREMAKDAVQETFIRVYRQIDKYNSELPFSPWFYRILTNECLRLLKKENAYTASLDTDIENSPSIAVRPFDQLFDLYEIVQSLEDKYRIPFVLKYVKGFSEKEISTVLELNQNTVKTRLFQGRKRLRSLLDLAERSARHDES